MNEQYRGFNLTAAPSQSAKRCSAGVTQWKPTGCIAYKGRDGAITELTRFQFPMTFVPLSLSKSSWGRAFLKEVMDVRKNSRSPSCRLPLEQRSCLSVMYRLWGYCWRMREIETEKHIQHLPRLWFVQEIPNGAWRWMA